jgi:hypothetical protein
MLTHSQQVTVTDAFANGTCPPCSRCALFVLKHFFGYHLRVVRIDKVVRRDPQQVSRSELLKGRTALALTHQSICYSMATVFLQ